MIPSTGDSNADTVLLVEDDTEIADLVAMNLSDLNLRTDRAADGKTGLEKALSGNYALVILDIMLPELDGLSVCRSIRTNDQLTPILMLTARSDEIDRVVGLEIGADDYLTKPFSVRELMARVKALLRRAKAGGAKVSAGMTGTTGLAGAGVSTGVDEQTSPIEFGALSIDTTKRKVMLDDTVVELTVKEFDLLLLFAKNPGRAYSRSDLLNIVWGYQYQGYEHTVNTHINRLRNKIEKDPRVPRYLKTVWGVGYRFAEDGELE